ncbi:MAG: response regulator [Myxococcota bacterium]
MSHRILLVCPDDARRQGYAKTLEGLGYPVKSCGTVEEAVELVDVFDPSTVALVTGAPPDQDVVNRLAQVATSTAMALVVMAPPLDVAATVDLLCRGVSAVFSDGWDRDALRAALLELLGEEPSDDRFEHSVLRHGPLTFARIHHTLTERLATGDLHVQRGTTATTISYRDGQMEPGEGDAALAALLESSAPEHWDFQFRVPVVGREEPDSFDVDVVEEDATTAETPEPVELPDAAVVVPAPGQVLCLLVEDDKEVRHMYARLLGRNGIVVESAPDGKLGYDMARAVHPDVIISDVMMPGVDGWGLLSLVRHDFHLRETPFFLLSCHQEKLDQLRDADAGANGYLPKGMKVTQIAARIQDAVTRQREILFRLARDGGIAGRLAEVGIQHLLAAMSRLGVSGVLHVVARGAHHEVVMARGRLVEVKGMVGETPQSGRDALRWLLTLGDGHFEFEPTTTVTGWSQGVPVGALVEEVCEELNTLSRNVTDRLLLHDGVLDFNPLLLRPYLLNCPATVQPVVQALSTGTPPRRLMESDAFSPMLVDAVVEDLLVKGVARLRGAQGVAA